MILESVTLTNWKSIPNVTVDLCEGINILYGPNEIGKSTLLEAIELGLTGEAHSTKAEYKALVPWNTKVKAHVSLILRNTKGKKYVINKSFPKGDAELFLAGEETPSRTLIAEGREVNSAILERLGIEEDLESLITLLWIKQGEALNLFNPKQNSDTQIVTGGLKHKIEQLIKERLTSPIAEEFYSGIRDEYDDYFLQSGKLKTAKNSAGKRVSGLESVKAGLTEEINTIREKLSAVRSIAENMQALDSAIAESEAELKTAESEKKQLAVKKKAWDALLRLRETYAPVRKAFSELVRINSRLEEIRGELPAAYTQKKWLIENRIKEIEERLGQYRGKKKQLEQAKKEVFSFKPVDEKEIEAVVELETAIKTLSVQLEKTQINLSITPEKPVDLVLRKDEEEARETSVSDPETLQINQSAEIMYPGHFSLEITGPLTEEAYKKLNRQQREAARKRESILESYGVENGKELRDYAARYRELTGRITRLQDELTSFNPDQLEKEKAGLKQDVEKDSEQLELFGPQEGGEITAEVQQFTTLREIEQHITELEQEDRHLSRRKIELLGDMDYEEFETDVLLKKREIEEKTEQLRTLEPRDREEITETMIAEKERAVEKQRDRIGSFKEEKAGMAGRLTGEEDLEEQLSEREYRLRMTGEELEEEYRNSKAVTLLLSLMDNAKQEKEAETVGPVQERISSFFEELTGGKYRGFYLDKDFKPVTVDARTFDGSSVQFAPSLLSVGAQEQLSFLFRFSLATRLAEEETQIMALDDSFVNTDSSRLAALFSLLSSAKQRIQFLIFTCNEQNFKKFRDECTMIDLSLLIRTA